jgi:EF hand
MKILQVIALAALVSVSSVAFAKDKAAAASPDTNGDGKVSKEEIAAQPADVQTKLKAADANGDGELNAEELAAYEKSHEKKKKDK